MHFHSGARQYVLVAVIGANIFLPAAAIGTFLVSGRRLSPFSHQILSAPDSDNIL